MLLTQFIAYVVSNIHFYLITLLICSLIFAYIYYKKICVNKIDFIYNWQWWVAESFCVANVLLLFYINKLSIVLFRNFLLSLIIFYFTRFFLQRIFRLKKLYERRKKVCYFNSKGALLYTDILFFIYFLFFFINIFINGAGGFVGDKGGGIIISLSSVINSIFMYSLIYCIIKKTCKRHILYLLFVFLTFIFGHSKSSVLFLFLHFLLFYLMNPNDVKVKRIIKKYGFIMFIISIGFAVFLIIRMAGGSITDGFLGLIIRFIAFGDIYIYGFVDDYIQKIYTPTNFFSYLFFLGLCFWRFLPYSHMEGMNLSGRLIKHVYGPGFNGGPNPKFNVLGILLFGLSGNLYFSFFISFIFFYAHYFLIKRINCSFKKQISAIYVFSALSTIEQDAMLLPQFISKLPLYLFLIVVFKLLEYSSRRIVKN